MTPLNVSQKLEEAKIPCDEPDLDRREAQTSPLGLSDVSVSRPTQTWLACGTPGGPYQVVIWESADASNAALKYYCLQDSLKVFYDEQEIEYGTELTDFDRPDLGVGSNWVARATADSIVSTVELAQALGGTVTTPDALCSPFAGEATALVDSEQQRLTAEDAAMRQLQDESSLAAALSDPAQGLVMAISDATSAAVLMRLAQVSDDFRVGCALAKNANLPTAAFAVLAGKSYPDMAPRTDWEDGTKYRGQVGVCLAENSLTPLDVLQMVTTSRYKDARKAAYAAIAKRG